MSRSSTTTGLILERGLFRLSNRASVLHTELPGSPPSCQASSFVCVHSGINCKPIAGPVWWPAEPSVPGESHCSPGLGERHSEGKPLPTAAAGEGAALRRGIQSDRLDCPNVGWGRACECWKRDKFCLLSYLAAAQHLEKPRGPVPVA